MDYECNRNNDSQDHSTDADWVPKLTDELREELDRRIEALEATPDDVVSWEQIERQIRRER